MVNVCAYKNFTESKQTIKHLRESSTLTERVLGLCYGPTNQTHHFLMWLESDGIQSSSVNGINVISMIHCLYFVNDLLQKSCSISLSQYFK